MQLSSNNFQATEIVIKIRLRNKHFHELRYENKALLEIGNKILKRLSTGNESDIFHNLDEIE